MNNSSKILAFFLSIFIYLFPSYVFAKNIECNSESVDKFINAQKISSLDISIPKSKRWVINYMRALEDQTNLNILDKYKKKFSANIIVKFDNNLICEYPSEIRISGDHKDHLDGSSTISSLDVSLLEGNINSVVKFKLFIPKTKGGENEVFSAALFKELGYLAPLTYIVPAKFNGQETSFLFQEKITKEFVESNGLREAPILEGDERFLFANDNESSGDRFGLARIKNNKWIEKGPSSLQISKIALTNLNKGYLEYLFRKHIYKSRNDRFLGEISASIQDYKRYQGFHTILVAIGASHALRPHNRTFYYDPMYRAFRPIYYDGNSKILKMIKPNIGFMYFGEKINRDEIMGSSYSLNQISNINHDSFHLRLKRLGLDISMEKMKLILEMVSANILTMKSPANINLQHKNPYLPYFSNNVDLLNYSQTKKLVFSNDNNSNIEVCDLSLMNCTNEEISLSNYSKLLEGRYVNNDKYSYIFIGNKKEYESGLGSMNKNTYQKVSLTNDSQLIIYGSGEAIVNKIDKTIELTQKKNNDKFLIKNGNLEDWSIMLHGAPGEITQQRFDNNLLTGCLTLLDLNLNNINLIAKNTFCEDGINLVRVKGNINSIEVLNASSDAIDVDSSLIKLNKVLVQNAGNDCVDFSSGNYKINFTNLNQCGDKAISVGENSKLSIDSAMISNALTGIVSKDSSSVYVNEVTAHSTLTCFAAYNKKQEFWGGKLSINNHNCQSNQIFQEKRSLVEFLQ